MPEDAAVWRALLRAKGLTVSELATQLHTTRQHTHRLLTGRRSADARRDDLDRALALGPSVETRPAYSIAVLDPNGDLELLPAGDTQPLFADRELAVQIAESLGERYDGVCVVPVSPEYAWRRLVAFHAAWGSDAEPRRVFLVDDPGLEVPVMELVDELERGFAATLRLRTAADDPARLREIGSLRDRLH
jgi:transcriptional regulator with XRE-family HTH domain